MGEELLYYEIVEINMRRGNGHGSVLITRLSFSTKR
jgi:hypothetical protein